MLNLWKRSKQSKKDEPEKIDFDSADVFECECKIKEGQLHEWGCQWEYCPFCYVQVIAGCDCAYELLNLKSHRHPPEFEHLPEKTYKNGLTDEQEEKWFKLCVEKGRIPFLHKPQLCARCGCQWPDLFVVQDVVWRYYTHPFFHEEMLCLACFNHIRRQVDRHNEPPSWLPSDQEIEEYLAAWRKGDKKTLARLEPKKWPTSK